MIETLSLSDQQDLSLPQTTKVIAPMGQDDIINLRFSQIRDFQHIFTQAFAKLELCLSQLKNFLPSDKSNPVSAMLDFISSYQSSAIHSILASPAENAERLSLDFFFSYQPVDYFPRHFLFGTPSQKHHAYG